MAGDNTAQRQNVASKTVTAVTQITDALYALQELSDQRGKFVSPFADSDFTGSGNGQLTAAMIGTFFDFVLPRLQTCFKDVSNTTASGTGQNEQIMLQMRAG